MAFGPGPISKYTPVKVRGHTRKPPTRPIHINAFGAHVTIPRGGYTKPYRPPTLGAIRTPAGSIFRKAGIGSIAAPVNATDVFDRAALHGIYPHPNLKPVIGERNFRIAKGLAHRYVQGHENLKQPQDLTNAILLATGVGDVALGGKLALGGIRALAGGGERVAAEQGAKALGRATVSRELGAAGKAAVRQTGARRVVRTAGKVAKYPLKHPNKALFGGPFAAQVPAVAVSGDPGQFKKALSGTGLEAQILGGVAKKVSGAVPGVTGHALGDILNLPAQVLPSTYIVGAAGFEAAKGRPQRLQQLKKSYLRTDFLPALVQGHFGEALKRAGQHPVYAGLEALGVKALAGRSFGAVARAGGAPERRPPLKVYGDVAIQRGRYSKDIFKAAVQRAHDRRIAAKQGNVATPRQGARYLRHALDREVFASEQVRRGELRKTVGQTEALRPPGKGQADAVSHMVQRIARSPETARQDLHNYREDLVRQRSAQVLDEQGHKVPALTGSKLKANEQMVESIDKALAYLDPQAIAHAAEQYTAQQAPVVKELVDRGLLTEEQARKASAIPFARVHMGARHGLSNADQAQLEEIRAAMKETPGLPETSGQLLGQLAKVRARRQTLTAKGEPLALSQIEAEMQRQGVARPGFLTQRPGATSAADFYRSYGKRPSLPRERRTGQATTQGTFDPSFDALVHQATRNRTILDATRNFDHITKRFGLAGPGGRYFANTAEARLAAENPGDFGMHLPEIKGGYVPWRIAPWPAMRRTLEAAKEHGTPAQADAMTLLSQEDPQIVDGFMADSIKQAQSQGEGATVLIPKVIADGLRDHFQPALPLEKAAQSVTGAFKGAILPTSPGWFAGNILDNWVVRAGTAGITPWDIAQGKGFAKIVRTQLGPDEAARALESIVPGGLYAEFARIQPHRAAEQFLGTHVEAIARTFGTFLRAPGVRTIAKLYTTYRDAMFAFDGKYVEQLPQYGMLGKKARAELGMGRSQFQFALRRQEPAVIDLANGLRNTDHQIEFARAVEAQFGNWGKNSPEARRFLTTWAPFWMWARAATKFVMVTLPRDHPILTGLIASAEQMTREERKKLGFDFNATLPLPGFLQGGIPGAVGGGPAGTVTKLSNVTSFGVFSDYPQFLSQVPAPQFAGLVQALSGTDWKGDKLVDSQGRPANAQQRVKVAIATTLDGFIPFLNVARQVIKHHGPSGLNPLRAYPPSTTNYLRSLSQKQQITVPVSKAKGAPTSRGSGGVDYGKVFSGGSGSGVDYGKVFSGG